MNKELIEAVNSGNVEEVRRLISEKGKVEARDVEDALKSSAEHGHDEVMGVLLEDQRVESQEVGNALVSAALKGRLGGVELLLRDDRLDPKDVGAALIYSVKEGYSEVSKSLLEDQRLSSKDVGSALIEATVNGRAKVIEAVLADNRLESKELGRALIRTVQKDSLEMTKTLLADERIESKEVEFVLSTACKSGKKDMVRVVLEDGRASPNAINQALLDSVIITYSEVPKLLLSRGAEATTEGAGYDKLQDSAKERMLQCKAAKDAIDSSVESCPRGFVDKKFVALASAADVFSSDKSIAEIAAPESKKLIDAVVQRVSELDAKMQQSTRDFVVNNSSLIDHSLAGSNPKEWDVKALGAQKALANLAMRHGGEITGVEELQGAGVKVIKDFIDHIPEKDGRIGKYSVGEYEARVLGKDVLYGKDKVLNMNAMKEVLKYLKPGDIRLAETKAHHELAPPKLPQPASGRGEGKQGPRGGKGGGMGGR